MEGLNVSGTLYFEDLEVDSVFTTPARTVTEADLVAFAGLSGDYNRIHTDAEYARGTIFGERVVHGVLGISILTGLMDRLGIFDGSAIAMLGIDGWRFEGPILVGDTIHVRMTITGLRRTSRGDRGVVDRHFEIVNQRDEVVQAGDIGVLVHCRSGSSDEG